MVSLFKQPKKPEPMNVGAVTQQANTQNVNNAFQNASFNRINQQDAMGNTLSYAQNGTDAQGNPVFSANQQLGQRGQDYATGLAGLGQQYFQSAGSRPDMGSGAAFDQAYGYASANLEPRFQRATDAMENRLRNQGLDPTSEAYKSAANDLALQQNEARNNLVTGLQGQMFNQGLQDRQQQMSELAPGISGGQQFLQPGYVNAPQVGVQNVDVAGLNQAAKAGEWQGYQADSQRQGAMIGGLAGIGGALVAAPFTGGASLFAAAPKLIPGMMGNNPAMR
jgi:hypothetical protein